MEDASTDPDLPVSPELRLDPDASIQWVLLLYGATMLAVQGFETTLRWLYVVVNADPNRISNASIARQWRNAFDEMWRAFQGGSAGMRLNDRKKGLLAHIPDDLYQELDSFIRLRRNPLAHTFLIERVSAEKGGRFAPGTILELLETTMTATMLTKRMQALADEVQKTWPTQPDPPAEVLHLAETMSRMAMLRQFPNSVIKHHTDED